MQPQRAPRTPWHDPLVFCAMIPSVLLVLTWVWTWAQGASKQELVAASFSELKSDVRSIKTTLDMLPLTAQRVDSLQKEVDGIGGVTAATAKDVAEMHGLISVHESKINSLTDAVKNLQYGVVRSQSKP